MSFVLLCVLYPLRGNILFITYDRNRSWKSQKWSWKKSEKSLEFSHPESVGTLLKVAHTCKLGTIWVVHCLPIGIGSIWLSVISVIWKMINEFVIEKLMQLRWKLQTVAMPFSFPVKPCRGFLWWLLKSNMACCDLLLVWCQSAKCNYQYLYYRSTKCLMPWSLIMLSPYGSAVYNL